MESDGYDGLFLDHDGVIVTIASKAVLRSAAVGAFGDVGVFDPRQTDVEAITVGVDPERLRAVATRYDVDPDQLWRCREDRIDATLRAEAILGRKRPYDDVSCLENIEVPIAVVSNNQTRIVESILELYGLSSLVDTIHARDPSRDSLHKKKPDPTYLEAAAAELGCSNPLYVGDSESDIVAGQRAGFDTVFLRREHNATRQLNAKPTIDTDNLETATASVRSNPS